MKGFFDNLFGDKTKRQVPPVIAKTPPPVIPSEIYKKGDLIGSKYEVVSVLGKGGLGVVLLVCERDLNVLIALKTFRDEFIFDHATKESFKREMLLWVNLGHHPFILSALFAEEVSGRLFIAMEAISPDHLGRVTLEDYLCSSERINSSQSVKWAIQFCLGMEHAASHGIKCHRDIKPTNILITNDGTLKVTDFGLATAAEEAFRGAKVLRRSLDSGPELRRFGFSVLTTDGKIRCGTPGYIAPEVYRNEQADVRSDIYSFGLVLWQMVAGSRTPPFVAPWRGNMEVYLRNIYDQQMTVGVPKIDGPLTAVIERCIRPAPDDRFHNFQELRQSLEPIWNQLMGERFEIPQIDEQATGAFWNAKGVALDSIGRYQEAICCYDKILEIDPQSTDAWGNKGNALARLARHEDAISCFDKVLTIDPMLKRAWLNKGKALFALGKHEEALLCCDKAISVDPDYSGAWVAKGNIFTTLGRPKEGIDCHNKALAANPRETDAWCAIGVALVSLGRREEAIACYDRALAIAPGDKGAWFNKGNTLNAIGRPGEAIVCFDRALSVEPDFANAWANRAGALFTLQRPEDAIKSYDRALAINPHLVVAWFSKGIVLASLSRHDEAILSFDKALAINPRDAGAWLNKALSEEAVRNWREAIASFQKYLVLSPNDPQIPAVQKRLRKLEKYGS